MKPYGYREFLSKGDSAGTITEWTGRTRVHKKF